MRIRFLLDENLSPDLKISLLRLNPQLDILRVGEPDAPPLGTLDPEILDYVESSQRLLVTNNRRSMPKHLQNHWDKGGHIWGLLWLRPSANLKIWVEELYLIWEASEAEEWLDRVDWIPF